MTMSLTLSCVLAQVVLCRLLLFTSSEATSNPQPEKQTFLEYYMLEELPPRSLVGNLVRDYGLDHQYKPAVLASLRFTMLTQSQLDRPNFVVDELTGDIHLTSRSLDRESICPRVDVCVVKFDVAVQPIQYFKIIRVKVEIVDVNDNAPIFPELRISHEISELAEPGTALAVPAATDLDSGRNAIYRYDVIPRDGKFELTSRATADGGTDLRLVLRDRLDRELEDKYLVTVLAVDGGDPPKTGSVLVNISIQDANDNNPQFDNSSYEVWASENVPVGTVILRLRARDRDVGQNARIIYEFSQHTAEQYGHLFGIKAESGKIYIKNNLDFETGSVYLLSVTASDQGPDSLPAHSSVIVRVRDINDNSAHIKINTLTSSNFAQVRENSDVGTFVAHLSVVDADSGDNGRFICSVDDKNFALQQIYTSELKLVTSSRLDRETRDKHQLSISCRDFGTSPLTSVVPLNVQVTDDNDHTPTFEADSYESSIEENNQQGAVLFRVTASDLDIGDNGRVDYAINREVERFVSVDRETGVVRAAVSLDRELVSELNIYLTATDRGQPPRSSSTRLHLVILDVDDNGPEFAAPRLRLRVAENQPPGTEVGTALARDRDLPPHNEFTYFLDRRYDTFGLFDLDKVTGVITTREVLDRERQSMYNLVVIARSNNKPTLSASAHVQIEVGDLNDNSPVFTWPSLGNETLAVSNQVPRGHVLATLRARDPDAGVNANLTYHLSVSGSGHWGSEDDWARRPTFIVIPETGAVLVAADLASITMETFVLRATVRDSGTPVLSDHALLRIVVSKDILYVRPNTDGLHGTILASEDMVIVLAFTLAIIIVAIVVIVIVICRLRRLRRRGHRLGGGRTDLDVGVDEEKIRLSATPTLFVDSTRSNGSAAYRTLTEQCRVSSGNGNLMGGIRNTGLLRGDGCQFGTVRPVMGGVMGGVSSKATAVVNAYVSTDNSSPYQHGSLTDEEDLKSQKDNSEKQFLQGNGEVSKEVINLMTSNSHAPWAGTCFEEAELSGRNCIRSSSDLNYLATTLPHVKTSWQSLKLQPNSSISRDKPPHRPVVVFIRDQEELYRQQNSSKDSASFPLVSEETTPTDQLTEGIPGNHPGHMTSYLSSYRTLPPLRVITSQSLDTPTSGSPLQHRLIT